MSQHQHLPPGKQPMTPNSFSSAPPSYRSFSCPPEASSSSTLMDSPPASPTSPFDEKHTEMDPGRPSSAEGLYNTAHRPWSPNSGVADSDDECVTNAVSLPTRGRRRANSARTPVAEAFAHNLHPPHKPDPSSDLDSDTDVHAVHPTHVLSPRARRARALPGYIPSTISPPPSVRAANDLDAKFGSVASTSAASSSAVPSKVPSPALKLLPELPLPGTPPTSLPEIEPSLRSLHSIVRGKLRLAYLLPSVILAFASSLVQPFVAIIVGEAFAALAAYPRDGQATDKQKEAIVRDVGMASAKLAFAGLACLVLEYLRTVAWTYYSEAATSKLRQQVFDAVRNKPMEWFDLGMGMNEVQQVSSEAVGAGGLLSKFTRETDDVREALGTASEYFLQSLSAFAVCFVLAMSKVPSLALVTTSSLPILLVINLFTQRWSNSRLTVERRAFAEASTHVERATAAIATVKAHNAQASELDRFKTQVFKAQFQLIMQAGIWGQCHGFNDFFIFSMFIVGFWYGATLVNSGDADIASVMTVFWASLLGAGSLQATQNPLMIIHKGMASLASLLTVIQDAEGSEKREKTPDITPSRCRGEIDFQDVYFTYPSRPDVPVLRGVTLFLPPGETTFIVGSSGSGKSTVAQLLLRLYEPQAGQVIFDSHDLCRLTPQFTRKHIACVQQGCLVFDMSVHDNVAMGIMGSSSTTAEGRPRCPADVSREEVIDACKLASIHDFILTLPQGYDTPLGNNGSQLSGGQKQRLAIARARIRDPTVLILDEATAALDATSRVEVFEAIKEWRRNSTTIVITHDLSQISADDFAYVLKDGMVVEQGYRHDLQALGGVFTQMSAEQSAQPLAAKVDFSWRNGSDMDSVVEDADDGLDDLARMHTTTFGLPSRPTSVASYYELIEGYTRSRRNSVSNMVSPILRPQSCSAASPANRHRLPPLKIVRRPSAWTPHSRRYRSRFPLSQPLSRSASVKEDYQYMDDLEEVELEKEGEVSEKELPETPSRWRRGFGTRSKSHDTAVPGFSALMRRFLPEIPNKVVFGLGIFASIARAVTTPIWSYCLAQLMNLLGTGTNHALAIKAATLLGVISAQGLVVFLQHFTLSSLSAKWTATLRLDAYRRILKQDKAWFDEEENSPPRLVHSLIKDVEDMRHLIASVLPRALVAVIMIGVGLIWAMLAGWQLTLVGLGIVPVFVAVGAFSSYTTSSAEGYNKAKREVVSRVFYETIANIRGIRAMALEESFSQRFKAQTDEAKRSAQRAVWVTSIGTSIAVAVPLFAQALLNYVGALFIKMGVMNLGTMLQVYTLVLFSVTFAVGMLTFLPLLAKAKSAAADFERLRTLPTTTSESKGEQKIPISGQISFSNVHFAYSTRPEAPVFTGLSFTLAPGESVAFVGPSGCGKSTVAALIQRLYEPSRGVITLGAYDVAHADVAHVRNAIAVVSQTPHLFDATVAENITYGCAEGEVPLERVIEAAKLANIHEFVTSLPQGYDTRVGENAALISGGQAQRLQIARALLRPSPILIFDESTSALDADNQRAILNTIDQIKADHTTIVITHSIEAMRRCDRVICLGDGHVAEDGTFDDLVARGGVFAQLMKTGEWE